MTRLSLEKIAQVAVVVAVIAHASVAPQLARAAAATGPTFDCENATQEIEILICADADLAKLDWRLAAVYNEATTPLEGKKLAELKAEQNGWATERNQCAKAENKRQCTLDAYTARLATLQARFGLVEGMQPIVYACDDKPESRIVVTYFKTDPPSATLLRSAGGTAGETVTVLLGPSGSGARYVGPSGLLFWEKGGEAMVEWPQGTEFHCKAQP